MPLVDSKRLAAFELGYQVRKMGLVLVAGIEGNIRKLQDVHACIKAVDVSYLVLAEGPYAAEYSNLKPLLHRVGQLHDVACEIRPVDETVSERRAIAEYERDVRERIELLSRRIVQRSPALDTWREVGDSLALLLYRVIYVYESAPIPVADWSPLNQAIDRLPPADREIASSFLRVVYRDLTGLGFQIMEAYGDICQYLSRSDRSDAHHELNPSPEGPSQARREVVSTSGSIWQNSGTGLEHTRDYTQCRYGGKTYTLTGVTRILVHALDSLTREGITTPLEEDLVNRAKELSSDDPETVKQLNGLRRKRLDKIFAEGGVWKTLVMGYKDIGARKGSYKLNTAPADVTTDLH